MYAYSREGLTISIHAPAWGATIQGFQNAVALVISIHAPAWGATISYNSQKNSAVDFNPRSRVGSDNKTPFAEKQKQVISIHAPAWGATINAVLVLKFWKFQSTLPRGERRNGNRQYAYSLGISIHAPAWGATHGYKVPLNDCINFNPRSRVGSDLGADGWVGKFFKFQSTLPRGERQLVIKTKER